MARKTSGTVYYSGKTLRVRIMLPNHERASVAFQVGISEAEGVERATIMNELSVLLGVSRIAEIKRMMQLVATCAKKDLRTVRSEVVALAREFIESDITFAQLADMWTSGALAQKYPDHVKAKASSAKDAGRLSKHVLPRCGHVPVRAFSIDDALDVLEHLPETLAPGSRRQVAQLISRLMSLAVFPLRKIAHSPIPKGFLPEGKRELAKQYLYVREEEKLIRCENIPLGHRVLYAFLARNGCRISEALALEWRDINLTDQVVTLDKNKTSDPRAWKLSDDVVLALREWRKRHMYASHVFVSEGSDTVISDSGIAELFREHLRIAGIDRPELMVDDRKTQKPKDVVRIPIRVHDLRATFVTISLAAGKTDVWVVDRTGHRSWSMVRGYRRSARLAAELSMGDFAPMHASLGFTPSEIPSQSGASSKKDSVPILSQTEGSESDGLHNTLEITEQKSAQGQNRTVDTWIFRGSDKRQNAGKSTKLHARAEQIHELQNTFNSSRDNIGTESEKDSIEDVEPNRRAKAKADKKHRRAADLRMAVNNTIEAAKTGKRLPTLAALEDLAALTKWGKA